MAYGTNLARTIKNGTLTFKNSAAASVTVTFMDGGLRGSIKQTDFQPVRHRGVIQQYIVGDDMECEGSISLYLVEILGTTTGTAWSDLNPLEIILGTNNNTVTPASTTTGTAGETTLTDIVLTIADPDAVGSETLTWAKCCFPTAELEEGYPDRVTVSWKCRGGLTVAYSAS